MLLADIPDQPLSKLPLILIFKRAPTRNDEPHRVRHDFNQSVRSSGVDIIQTFSSVTIPPVIKTVVCNGRTLVYRVQNAIMDLDTPGPSESEPKSQSVSHCDATMSFQ